MSVAHAGFADVLERIDRASLAESFQQATPSDVRRALRAERPTHDNLAALLSPAAEPLLAELAARAHELTRRHFGPTMLLYAPLYISNECDNACVYCGFGASNAIERRTLGAAEALYEARALREQGFRHVLLLTGEAPRAIDTTGLAEVARAVRPHFDSVSIEVFPMSTSDYCRMVEAGVDGLTVYQETYDRDVYAVMHPRGRKRDYDARLGAPERGASAGMRSVGVGCLLGLTDFRTDAYLATLHASFLTRRYWRTHVAVSFPRIRAAEGGFSPPSPVSDRQLAQVICATRIFLPRAGLVLSTRESPKLRDALAPLGITQMSAGSRTEPGGYTRPGEAGRQFAICDERSPAEFCSALRSAGYDPVWKDWDPAFAGLAR